MTNSISCVEQADAFFVIGSNPTENHPLIGARILRQVTAGGAKLVVADPRRIHLASFADVYLQHRCGTDVALLNGIMNVILEEGLEDREFIAERTEDFEAFREVIAGYTPDRAEEITGVPRDDIIRAARIYASSQNAMIFYAMGITQHTTGVDNVHSCANLAMLTGNMGRPGTGVNPLRGQNNVQGACDLGGLPNVYSGYQKVTDPAIREKFEKAWGVSLPGEVGLSVTEIIHGAGSGKIRGLYIMGENPVLSDPDAHRVRECLEKCEFLVVQDIFMTDTAEYADVILPGVSFAEKDGTFTNTERRIQRIRKAGDGPGESRQDWEIITLLAGRMGYEMKYDSPSAIMDEMARMTPIYGGVSFKRLDESCGLQWPCPDDGHPGTPVLHAGTFSRGKGKFFPVPYKAPDEEPDDEYPFTLTTGRIYFHFHTGTMTRRTVALDREAPECYVEMNPEDAEALGASDRDMVSVTTRRGSIRVRVFLTPGIRKGTIFVPFHFREAAANVLTNPVLDPTAKIPEYKVCAARVELERKEEDEEG